MTVLAWIKELNRRGTLLFLILENVVGILSKNDSEERAPIDTIMEKLREDLPNFNLTYTVMNAEDYGLPQHRERCYIYGIRTRNMVAGLMDVRELQALSPLLSQF